MGTGSGATFLLLVIFVALVGSWGLGHGSLVEGLETPPTQCCQKWVQTLGCKGYGSIDLDSPYLKSFGTGRFDCTRSIDTHSSGYCLCKDGTKLGYADCGHPAFSCQDVCKANCTDPGCTLPTSLGTAIIGGDKDPCAAGEKLKDGSSCSVKCDKGYKPSGGTEEYNCKDGHVTSATLRCAPIACTVPDQFGVGVQGVGKNACLTGAALKAAASCGVGCRKGYKSQGGTSAYKCGETGELEDASLKCRRVTCPLPTRFGEGRTWGGDAPCESGGDLLAGQHCTIKCASGHRTTGGSPTYLCGDTGVLDEATLRCVPNTCKLPQKFGAGKMTGGDRPCSPGGKLDAGGDCTIKCSPGYKPVSGSADYTCDQKGALGAASLECEPVTCRIPTGFGAGVAGTGEKPCVPGAQLNAGKSCAVGCAGDYELVGAGMRFDALGGTREFHCSKAGFLTEPDIKCKENIIRPYNSVWAIDFGGSRN
jgi:hypothetical protein